MKRILIFLVLGLIVWYVITSLEPQPPLVTVKDLSKIESDDSGSVMNKVLWVVLIVIEALFCHSLYRYAKVSKGVRQILAYLFMCFGIIILFCSLYILYISLTALWL
jgi:hypothetical protein